MISEERYKQLMKLNKKETLSLIENDIQELKDKQKEDQNRILVLNSRIEETSKSISRLEEIRSSIDL